MGGREFSKRIEYVDRLRGMAVVGMFFVHSGVAWLAPAVRETPYWKALSQFSGMVAPVFMFLAGISVALVAHNAEAAAKDMLALRRQISLRGLKILALGYAIHLFFFLCGGMSGSWIRALKVDILHCIGFGLCVFPWIAWPKSRFNWQALILFFALVLGSTITFGLPLEQWLPTGVASYLSVRPSLALFPVIPYAAWIALGLFVGAIWAPVARDAQREKKFWLGLVLFAMLAGAAGFGLKWVCYNTGVFATRGGDIQARGMIHLFLFKTAWLFVLFTLVRALARYMDRVRFDFFVLFGRTSLAAYVVHLFFVYHLGGALLVKSLAPALHIAGATTLTVLIYALLNLYRRKRPMMRFLRWKTAAPQTRL